MLLFNQSLLWKSGAAILGGKVFSCALLRLALMLTLLVTPIVGLSVTGAADSSDTKIETLGSILSQADRFRINVNNPDQLKQAFSLYQHAAHHGVDAAQYWLGVMYFKGQGTESDVDKAKYWISLSAKQAYPPAEQFLSELQYEDDEEEDC